MSFGPVRECVSHTIFIVSGSAQPGLIQLNTKVAQNLAFHFILLNIGRDVDQYSHSTSK